MMKKERVRQHIYLDTEHQDKLQMLSEKSRMSMSAIIRMLLDGAAIREMPSVDYHNMVRELHKIGSNMNQIARVANGLGLVNQEFFSREAANLRDEVLKIQRAVLLR